MSEAPSRWRGLLIVVRLALVAASVWALSREFAGLTPAALVRELAGYGWSHALLGLAAVAASFLLLGAMEILALRTHGGGTQRVTARTAIGTAFVSHAVSQSAGIALLTGTAVRLRSYQRLGLQPTAVAQVSAAVTLTVTLGLLAAGGWALLGHPAPLTLAGHSIPLAPAGTLLCLTVAAYLAWSVFGRGRAAPGRRWGIPRPRPAIAFAQVALATVDWLTTGAVLFVFIPPELGFGLVAFLQLYLIAQLIGVLSHVPAGAGVFEVALLALLVAARPGADRAGILAAIVMYRALYYILPLAAAMVLAGGYEWRRRRRAATGAFDVLERPLAPPSVLSLAHDAR